MAISWRSTGLPFAKYRNIVSTAGKTRRFPHVVEELLPVMGSSTSASAAAFASTVTSLGTPFGRPGPPRFSPVMSCATVFLDFFFRSGSKFRVLMQVYARGPSIDVVVCVSVDGAVRAGTADFDACGNWMAARTRWCRTSRRMADGQRTPNNHRSRRDIKCHESVVRPRERRSFSKIETERGIRNQQVTRSSRVAGSNFS